MIYSILSGAIREDNNKQINLQIYYGGHRSYAMKNCLQGQFKQTPSTTILFCTRFLVAFLFYWTSASICHVWIHFCFQNIQVKIIINRNNRNPYIKRYKTQHFKEHFTQKFKFFKVYSPSRHSKPVCLYDLCKNNKIICRTKFSNTQSH